MQNVSEEFKTAIASPSPKLKSRIIFPDLVLDDYQVRSINLNSLLVGSEDFEIGMAPMDMVQIELVYAPDEPIEYDFEGKECEIELGVNIPFTHEYMEFFTYGELGQYTYDELEEGMPEYVPLGLFTVEKATKDVMALTLDCVDRMYKAEKEYVSDLMYPTTILDILESACDQAGIELATTTFANADYIVPNEPVYEGVTCRKVFAQVAELAGGYAKINRLGQLEIVTLGNESVRDITKDHYFDLKINEVAKASIDKVIVKVGEETATKGDGENIYTIVDNMFVQGPNNVVDALYSVLKNVSYTACTFKWQGDFSLDLGDKVTVDGNDTYVLSRKLTYTGGLREDYSAPAKSNIEKNSTGKGSLLLDIENVKTQIKVIDGEITQKIEQVEGKIPNEVAEQLQNAEIYTWIRYADDEYGNGISDSPAGKKYVGIAVNKKNIEPSNNPSDYEWSRVQGEQGAPGKDGSDGYTPIKGVDYFDGQDGQDGQSSFLWVRYSQNANGDPMSSDPTNAIYIGIATTLTPSAPTDHTAYQWSLIKGTDGVAGKDGDDGQTSYVHIKYSNDGGATFTANNGETVGDWIGIYVDFNPQDSNNVNDYTWNKVKGEQGPPGIPGEKGADGQSQWTHIRYSINANGNPMTTTPSSDTKYIGIAVTTSSTAPSGYTSYSWAKFVGEDGEDGQQGVPGPPGADGVTYYTWIKYADTPTSGMSDNPAGKPYIGIAHNKTTPTESVNYNDYTWSLIKGDKGDDGQTTYTWIKYADDKFGNGMSDDPDDKRYVGIATNKTTPNKSTNPSDYEWSPLYDNVEIGGENRLFDSRTNIEFYSNHALDIRLVRGPSKPYYRAFNPSGSNINLFAVFPNSRFAEPLESLGRVTVSLEVMTDVDRNVTINGATFPVKGGRWAKIHFSKTFDENTTKHWRVRNPFSRKRTRDIDVGNKLIEQIYTDINTLYYRNLQVEKGNVPTDWNLTPEELEGSITRTSTEIKQLSDSISLIARRNENTGRFEVTPESIVAAIDTTEGVGRVKTVGVTINENGLTVENGAVIIRDAFNTAIITSNGLKVMYSFSSAGQYEGWQMVGICGVGTPYIDSYEASIPVQIPEKLIIETATLYAHCAPAYITGAEIHEPGVPDGLYYPQNLALYVRDFDATVFDYPWASEYRVSYGSGGLEISDVVWEGRWTPDGEGVVTKSGNVKNYLTPGERTVFVVQSTDLPTNSNRMRFGIMKFDLVIEGFLRG